MGDGPPVLASHEEAGSDEGEFAPNEGDDEDGGGMEEDSDGGAGGGEEDGVSSGSDEDVVLVAVTWEFDGPSFVASLPGSSQVCDRAPDLPHCFGLSVESVFIVCDSEDRMVDMGMDVSHEAVSVNGELTKKFVLHKVAEGKKREAFDCDQQTQRVSAAVVDIDGNLIFSGCMDRRETHDFLLEVTLGFWGKPGHFFLDEESPERLCETGLDGDVMLCVAPLQTCGVFKLHKVPIGASGFGLFFPRPPNSLEVNPPHDYFSADAMSARSAVPRRVTVRRPFQNMARREVEVVVVGDEAAGGDGAGAEDVTTEDSKGGDGVMRIRGESGFVCFGLLAQVLCVGATV